MLTVETKHDKGDDFKFPIVNFKYINKSTCILSISLSLDTIPHTLELVVPIRISQEHIEHSKVADIAWLTVTKCLCYRLPRICSVCCE